MPAFIRFTVSPHNRDYIRYHVYIFYPPEPMFSGGIEAEFCANGCVQVLTFWIADSYLVCDPDSLLVYLLVRSISFRREI